MKNLVKYFLYFFKSKWVLKKPERKKVLIYDDMGSAVIKQYVYKKDYEIYYNRGEFVNLYVLFFSIFKDGIFNLIKNYKKNYFNFVDPKVAITFIDNNPGFYKIKKNFPKIIFLSIQNGVRINRDFINMKKGNHTDLTSDYMLTFSNEYSQKYAKFIKSEFIPIGSFILNSVKLNCSEKKDILFISKMSHFEASEIVFNEFVIIEFLIKYCKERKLHLDIALKKDFKKLFGNDLKNKYDKIKYKFNTRRNYSYYLLKDYKVIVFTDSTLGYESLAIGKKTVSCTYGSLNSEQWSKKHRIFRRISKFGHPIKFKNKGPFWLNYFDAKTLEKILNNTVKISNKQWKKKNKKIIDKIIAYDSGNKYFVNILKKYNISTRPN